MLSSIPSVGLNISPLMSLDQLIVCVAAVWCCSSNADRQTALPRSGPTTDDLKSRVEFAGGTDSCQSEIDGRIVPAAAHYPAVAQQQMI